MNIGDFKEQLRKLIEEVGYIRGLEVIDESANTIKARLLINELCFIQVYVNLKKGLRNYVVILSGGRIYGMDCDGGQWHYHPWDNPCGHEYAKEVPLKEFLFQVYRWLKTKNIL